jgi:hypothetical protein
VYLGVTGIPFGHVAFAKFKQFLRLGFFLAFRAFAYRFPITVVLDPPNAAFVDRAVFAFPSLLIDASHSKVILLG